MEEHIYKPQSLMSFGYDPKKSEGAGKLPVFLNSTFVSESALQLKNSFDIKYGLREPGKGEEAALVYGRINDPDKQVFEERFTKWESGAEACVVFGSGMAAGTTVCSEFSEHGGVVFCSDPLYGGTNHYLIKMLSASGVKVVFFDAKKSQVEIIDMIY